MKPAKKLYTKRWDFELYEVKGEKIITVIFFDQIDYPRSFKLNREVEKKDYDSLSKLSEEIRNNYESFKESEITPPIFH